MTNGPPSRHGSPEPEILRVFREAVEPRFDDPDARLDDDLDTLLGFAPADGFAPVTEPSTWPAAEVNYRSLAERRMQELVPSFLAHFAQLYPNSRALSADRICARIVRHEYTSPVMEKHAGYYFIVLPWGYLKSVENVWRHQQWLGFAGQALPPLAQPRIATNMLHGATIERVLERQFELARFAYDQIVGNRIWRDAWKASFVAPEQMMRNQARLAVELREGLYATEGERDDAVRISSSPDSRWLTRCTLAYVLMHELAHVLFRHENEGRAPPSDEHERERDEMLCDTAATLYWPRFSLEDSGHWGMRPNEAHQFLAGPAAFFSVTELWELAGLISFTVAQGEGQKLGAQRRLGQLRTRARAQQILLLRIGEKDPSLRPVLQAVMREFRAFVIGMQMTATRAMERRTSRFYDHLYSWENDTLGSGI